TTTASTAEPRLARPRISAARRARASESTTSTAHAFRNLFVEASRSGRPVRHSTSTALGTTGGQSPLAVNTLMSAAARIERVASRVTPPLSRTSTVAPLAGLRGAMFEYAAGYGLGAG